MQDEVAGEVYPEYRNKFRTKAGIRNDPSQVKQMIFITQILTDFVFVVGLACNIVKGSVISLGA